MPKKEKGAVISKTLITQVIGAVLVALLMFHWDRVIEIGEQQLLIEYRLDRVEKELLQKKVEK